ncbi:MAG: FAD-dependent oxidoreductase [Deltaproteobacteria bacterium]|nr:FAD-dependent oxidoreductase [Deltaproteobacteria bacterium]MCL5792099.1 FAD-dependent oxidoreductase [Deltaproteobacteria bacterium]
MVNKKIIILARLVEKGVGLKNMKEEKTYLSSERESFDHLTAARRVERTVFFSTNKKDFAWMRENVPCQTACPALTNIPGYIYADYQERYGRSYEINRYVNILPGVLGRICSRPCELACRHGWPGFGESVAICHLKRIASDFKPEGHRIEEFMFGPSGKKVAVVGSGPSGLGAAHDLAIFGHKVTIYEALEHPGGMLRYGIPEFRLPRNILDVEISNILRLGVDLNAGVRVGRDIKLEELLNAYDAVLLTTGTYSPNKLGIKGQELDHVYSGLDFMMDANSGRDVFVGSKVLVVGGGYTAMDCARTSLRLGAKRVIINVLTTEDYITVNRDELNEVKTENVEIRGLVSIEQIERSGNGLAVRFRRNRLGGYGEKGERLAVPIKGSDFTDEADSIIYAIGQRPETGFVKSVLKLEKNGMITFDRSSSATDVKGLFAAGDFGTGASTVIESISSGRIAAWSIDRYLVDRTRRKKVVRFEKYSEKQRERAWDFIPRQSMPTLPVKERVDQVEVELGLNRTLGKEEAKRCYLCYLKFEIDVTRCIYCRYCMDVCPTNCIHTTKDVITEEDGRQRLIATDNWKEVSAIVIDNNNCIRCGNCKKVCPVECIDVVKAELIEQDVEV